MNKIKFSILTLVSLVIFACSKSEDPKPATDAREQFVGTWKGTFFEDDSANGANLIDIIVGIKKEEDGKKIALYNPQNNATLTLATVDGSKATVEAFTFLGKNYAQGGIIEVTSSNKAATDFTYTITANGKSYNGISKGTFTKQ